MKLTRSKGNMYPWVSHTFNHLAGECPHGCPYCYVQAMQRRFGNMPYSGQLRLVEEKLSVEFGSGKTIFIENCNDLFANDVPEEWIDRILEHCERWPKNTYVFQTKNPRRIVNDVWWFPNDCLIGTTVETNRENDLGNAPSRRGRLTALAKLFPDFKTFVTIEPILDFDPYLFVDCLVAARPSFVNIGADSKGCGLPEPSYDKVMMLIHLLKDAGIEVREKRNLERLKQ